MKILVHGLSPTRGYPLALALRDWGHHSVVGWGNCTDDSAMRDWRIKQSLSANTDILPIPVAPQMDLAISEGSDLAIVAGSERQIGWALQGLAHGWRNHLYPQSWSTRRHLPVVVVTPTDPRRIADTLTRAASVLEIGFAPFDFRGDVLSRLLSLRQIQVSATPSSSVDRLREAVRAAWTPIDNKIPIYVRGRL